MQSLFLVLFFCTSFPRFACVDSSFSLDNFPGGWGGSGGSRFSLCRVDTNNNFYFHAISFSLDASVWYIVSLIVVVVLAVRMCALLSYVLGGTGAAATAATTSSSNSNNQQHQQQPATIAASSCNLARFYYLTVSTASPLNSNNNAESFSNNAPLIARQKCLALNIGLLHLPTLNRRLK